MAPPGKIFQGRQKSFGYNFVYEVYFEYQINFQKGAENSQQGINSIKYIINSIGYVFKNPKINST